MGIGQQIINGTYGLDNRQPTAYEELKAWCEKWHIRHFETQATKERDRSIVLIGLTNDVVPIYFCEDGDIEIYALPEYADTEEFMDKQEKKEPVT